MGHISSARITGDSRVQFLTSIHSKSHPLSEISFLISARLFAGNSKFFVQNFFSIRPQISSQESSLEIWFSQIPNNFYSKFKHFGEFLTLLNRHLKQNIFKFLRRRTFLLQNQIIKCSISKKCLAFSVEMAVSKVHAIWLQSGKWTIKNVLKNARHRQLIVLSTDRDALWAVRASSRQNVYDIHVLIERKKS